MKFYPVRDGVFLPKKDQEVLFIEDVRNHPERYWRETMNKIAASGQIFPVFIEKDKYVDIGPKRRPMIRMMHGWVSSVDYFEETNDWGIQVRSIKNSDHGAYLISECDWILWWAPMPEIPAEIMNIPVEDFVCTT